MESRKASWIWSQEGVEGLRDDDPHRPYRIRLFRRVFTTEGSQSALVHVSADTWYQLYCNGKLVGEGPAKGDVAHHFYDTYDLSEFLVSGENVLAARVIDVSPVESNPPTLGVQTSFIHYSGGFMLQSDLPVNTDSQWTVAVESAYGFHNEGQKHGGFVGFFEDLDAAQLCPGWNDRDFAETPEVWESARVLYPAITYEDRRDDETPYGLLPRQIPLLPIGPAEGFARVFQVSGAADEAAWQGLLSAKTSPDGARNSVQVPPDATATAVVDVGELTTGYPLLATRGGAGARIRLTYSEALRLEWDTEDAVLLGHKVSFEKVAWGYADEDRGWTYDSRGAAEGFCDLYRPSGQPYEYRPLRFRTFRFIKIEVDTGPEALEISGLSHAFTAYPFDVVAAFDTDSAILRSYWDISIRTYRLCCHETFEDCPYYEQMQYAGDSAITSQLAIWTSGDSRLTAQAIRHFDWSRIPDGISQSRYPSSIRQFIPSWSLHWIMMGWDYYQLTGDVDLVVEVLPGMRSVLDWFRRYSRHTGLPTRLPYWNNVDWSPDWDRGQPPGWDTGATAVISCQMIVALEKYRELLAAVAAPEDQASQLMVRAELDALALEVDSMRDAARSAFWDSKRSRVRDATTADSAGQYSAAWAMLADILPSEVRREVADALVNDERLAPASYFGLYYVIEALVAEGRYVDAIGVYERWREMAEFGISTWAEETTYWRSLCHAWSAHPALFFIRYTLGAMPTNPGFDGITIAPKPAGLRRASGRFATPKGPVDVAWHITDGEMMGEIIIDVLAPPDVRVTIIAPEADDGTETHEPVTGFESVAGRGNFDLYARRL